MIKKKIIETFRKNPDLKYLFLFDGAGQYAEELAGQHEDFCVKTINAPITFGLKINLEEGGTDLDEKCVLYHTFSRPAGSDFERYPLLGLYYANEELQLDEIATFMEAYSLTERHRSLIKQYYPFLNKTTQNKIIKILDDQELSEASLQRGLISVALDLHSVVDKAGCLMQYLGIGTEHKKIERVHHRLAEMHLDETFRSWIKDLFGYPVSHLTPETAQNIADKLKYNILTQHITSPAGVDTYSRLKAESTVALNRMVAFYQEWKAHPRYAAQMEDVFTILARHIDETRIFAWYGLDQEYGYLSTQLCDLLIRQVTKDFDQPQAADLFKKLLQHHDLPESYQAVIAFLDHAKRLAELMASSEITLCQSGDEFIKYYADRDYQIDSLYRNAHMKYKQINLLQQDLIQSIYEQLHRDYNQFLITQNTAWQSRLADIKFDYAQLGSGKQYHFFRDYLRDFDYKGAVIISDAFRYELAQELAGMLLKDDKILIDLEPRLASVPSNTMFGMANLLPHKKIEIDTSQKSIVLKINGFPTASQNRESIIQLEKPQARAVQYKVLNQWSQAEGRSFFIEHRLAYIYHNQIDAPSEKSVLEHYTFDACEKAIQELYDLFKKLYRWNVYHIFITADHGFLYNHIELRDADKEQLPKGNINYLDDTRVCIVDQIEKNDSGHQFPLSNTTNIDTDLQVIIPKAINRYRKQGNVSLKFDHGGASLQELVIPVLKVYKKDTKIRDQVTFMRIDNQRTISTTIKVSILQNEPVSNEMKSRTIYLGLYSTDNALISNEEKLVLEATQLNATARSYQVILSLTAEGSRQAMCYLRAFDESDKNRMNPLYINDQITIQSLYEKDEF